MRQARWLGFIPEPLQTELEGGFLRLVRDENCDHINFLKTLVLDQDIQELPTARHEPEIGNVMKHDKCSGPCCKRISYTPGYLTSLSDKEPSKPTYYVPNYPITDYFTVLGNLLIMKIGNQNWKFAKPTIDHKTKNLDIIFYLQKPTRGTGYVKIKQHLGALLIDLSSVLSDGALLKNNGVPSYWSRDKKHIQLKLNGLLKPEA